MGTKFSLTDLAIPPVIFGTTGLGNLFVALDEQVKCDIVKEYYNCAKGPMFFNSAGKYGAGLALEFWANVCDN